MIQRDLHLKGKVNNKNKAILREHESDEEQKERQDHRRMKVIIK